MDNIKMDLQEVRWGGMEWNDAAQVVNVCECSSKNSGSIGCGKFLD